VRVILVQARWTAIHRLGKAELVRPRASNPDGLVQVLADFAAYLRDQLPRVWAALQPNAPPAPTQPERDLVTLLQPVVIEEDTDVEKNFVADLQRDSPIKDVKRTVADALRAAEDARAALDAVAVPYNRNNPAAGWPRFLFPLADAFFSLRAATGPVERIALGAGRRSPRAPNGRRARQPRACRPRGLLRQPARRRDLAVAARTVLDGRDPAGS